MNTDVKSKSLIIRETKEYYGSDVSRRSYSDITGGCLYNSPNGNVCAFARCVKEEYRYLLLEGLKASSIINRLGYKILKDEYKVEDKYFWDDIQKFHDGITYWGNKGLTDVGFKIYIGLLKEHN